MIYIYQNANCISSVYDETILTEEEKTRGIALEELPIAEEKEGQIAILKVDKEKEKVWYEYMEDTRVKEEKQHEMKEETLTKAVAELTVENKKKDIMIKNLAHQISALNIKITKMGDVE